MINKVFIFFHDVSHCFTHFFHIIFIKKILVVGIFASFFYFLIRLSEGTRQHDSPGMKLLCSAADENIVVGKLGTKG